MKTTPFKTVLGTNHKKPRSRIWLEGERLKACGFTVGKKYNRIREKDGAGIFLMLSPVGNYTVSGKGDKPIIDITGSIVTEVFKGTHANVTFNHDTQTIDITPA